MHTHLSRGRRRGPVTALTVAMVLAIALPASTLGTARFPNPDFEYVTLTPAAAGGTVVALINSGDTFDGVTFEGIPDGLGVVPVGKGDRYVDLYVAFEQSHVPFQGFADFEDSSVQRARLDLKTMKLTKLDEVLPPSAGFIRFCSAFMAGPDEGFANYTFFVNEESNDVIDVPAGAPYGADPSTAPYRQAGYSVALDTKTGSFGQIASRRTTQPREHGDRAGWVERDGGGLGGRHVPAAGLTGLPEYRDESIGLHGRPRLTCGHSG